MGEQAEQWAPQYCDYHMHSTASDGSLSPAALMQAAWQAGLREVALTDHDTLNGIDEASDAAQALGLRLIPGMEFSCAWKGFTLHVVALWPQGLTAEAHTLAESQRQARWARAAQIVQRLIKCRCPVSLEEATAEAGGEVPGRPHFARVMVRKGFVKNTGTAFRKVLGSGKPGDVKRHWPDMEEAVGSLKSAGALTALAHPFSYKLTRSKRIRLVTAFAEAGGDAVEIVNGWQQPSQVQSIQRTCQELGLKMSWGSDFHSPGPGWRLGGFSTVPDDVDPLSQCWKGASGIEM